MPQACITTTTPIDRPVAPGGGIALGWIAARWGYPLIFEISATALVVAAVLILFGRESAELADRPLQTET